MADSTGSEKGGLLSSPLVHSMSVLRLAKCSIIFGNGCVWGKNWVPNTQQSVRVCFPCCYCCYFAFKACVGERQSQVHQLSPTKNQMAHSMWVIWRGFSKGTFFCEDVWGYRKPGCCRGPESATVSHRMRIVKLQAMQRIRSATCLWK